MLLAACAREDVVAELPSAATSDAGSPDGNTPIDPCTQSGPPLLVGDSGDTTCGSAVAERTFRFALCSCTDLVASNTVTTDAFDSAFGPYTMAGPGGSIGTNGGMNLNAPLIAGGSLWVAGASGITAAASAPIEVGADLHSGGPLAGSARVTIAREARVNGRVAAQDLTIGGTLTLPDGAAIDVPGTTMIGAIARAPVAVEAPCTCDQDKLHDIAAYVARHRDDANNDNAEKSIPTDLLAEVPTARTVELDCGRYYFSRISARAALTIRIRGRVLIFADNDLSAETDLEVEVLDGGEVDLFVAGNIVSAGELRFGSSRTPARARIYAGGSGTIQLSGGGVFAGNLYAPRAELVASAPIEAFGSIFVRRFSASAGVTIHYDNAVLRAGEDCEAPPPASCDHCGDCLNVACTNGQCAACTMNTECCPPLYCVGGRCEASPI